MVDFGEDGNLVIGELAQFGGFLEFFGTHDFDCIQFFIFLILSLVDIAVLSLS
jgi:hypothetical protein